MVEEEEEHEKRKETSMEWERVHYPRIHDRSLSDPSNAWSTPPLIDNRRSIVFPPINHEGLHVTTSTSTASDHDDHQQTNPIFSFSSVYDLDRLGPHSPPPTSGLRAALSDSERCWSRGFNLLRSKVIRLAFSLRSFASNAGVLWSFQFSAGAAPVAAAVLLVLMFLRYRWWLRRLRRREESRDQLIRIIKEKDEKISQLLRQIAQMNEILLAFHRVPGSKAD